MSLATKKTLIKMKKARRYYAEQLLEKYFDIWKAYQKA